MAKKQDGTDDGADTTIDTGADSSGESVNAPVIAFVNMQRDPDIYDAPHTAQVHPDEVQNYYPGGWVPVKEAE
ncbi:hypothetical protein [Pseudomonas sp. MWU12-2345]|uniref:hypothetical protein n=1 Tax=Pseudomonas sp. MWU12-2345 TaxID=2928689 RepID=UPI00200C341F|nr:hypothetical protein [Pseudomonas sp. MWU12-2345]